MSKLFRSKFGLVTLATVAVAIVVWFVNRNAGASAAEVPLISVQKGNLQINVLQGGEIRALQNYEVKSEIELPTKILSLIPEGYRITEEDVKNGKVLIELDSADLRDRITNHEIEFQTTVSAFIDADENRAIQTSDNQSLARDAEQAMRFALMDFERYMGKEVAQAVLKARRIPANQEELDRHVGKLNEARPRVLNLDDKKEVAPAKPMEDPLAIKDEKDDKTAETEEDAEAAKKKAAEATDPPRIDFLSFLTNDQLGDGEAQQKLRQLSNDLLLRQSELGIAKQNIEASTRLAAKEFITKTTLENDQVNFDKANLAVHAATTQLDLFKKYEFPKQAELFLSAYQEALTKLQRTLRANRSRMAQAESRFQTAKRRYEVELTRREDMERQLKACIIKAPVPGLVAYGSHSGSAKFSNDTIEEGAGVRFRQTLLTIPNMSAMSVAVSIHESQVKKVRLGQPCRITVDAEPGKTLTGNLREMAVLPDSSSSRFTPNLKLYPAVVHVDGTHDWLKPGMNAKVEIIVNELDDVLFVPVQSIEVENDHFFTYVKQGSSLERREVKTGSFNDEFIEIRSGLTHEDQVALAIPKRQTLDNNGASSPSPTAPKKEKAKEPAAEAAPAKKIAAAS
ncbi:CusB/HlyD membrane fusion family barrel-sandwich protein [Roseimicrobium gellanilyticum]|uniref:CusB/HlyD membrane fusion family barrel-sandwich protein n=1 Tax=Roseimicrobium gellanilyticum TaxID=748857 RepID=A0A366HPJ7_9BACT|nr:efflux RND transporter periplasmic adaptor subunit [Roseimicrobium gellanilyticum]RBP45415.1 CusB/HlyD membrane fusion family barrel-sandwich protein [Roseimicrobium gellanilyticum]